MTKVFISYSHDSQPHRDFVRGLSDQLRQEGLVCEIDQYINGFPPEGWQCWMENQIEAADFVLLVCTETYLRRYRGRETDGGRGVTFEGVVISQTLYDHYYHNTKFIPVIPAQGLVEHVPIPLKQYSTYRLPDDYETLYGLLSGQAKYIPAELGEIRPVRKPSWLGRLFGGQRSAGHAGVATLAAERIYEVNFPVTDNNSIVGRESLLALLNQYWEQASVRVVVLQAAGGVGKTALVNLWRERLRLDNSGLQPAARMYCWSFQNQGSQRAQTSSGAFFSHALQWFGAAQTRFASEHDKGVYLAQLINSQRSLLILDGVEVFQPHHHVAELQGRINDPALFALLKTLAQTQIGLCLLTSREETDPRLREYQGVLLRPLHNLSTPAALQLLQNAGIKGKAAQLEPVVMQYQRHAYSLVLVACYLKSYAQGDIRRLDTLPALLSADTEADWQGRQIMEAYAEKLEGKPDLGLLYVVSVFDHAVERGLIVELIRALASGYQSALNKLGIAGLRDTGAWDACFERLRKQGLLLGKQPDWLDLHPLVRAYFRRHFATQQAGIKHIIHKELYAYYKALPEKELPDTVEEMQPLFSAVAHGCAAGLHQQALDEVYWPRVRRKSEAYIVKKLGAFSDDLATVAHFFTTPWQTPAAGLTDHDKASVLNWAGFRLRALGRLREAVEPMQTAVDSFNRREDWYNVALNLGTLSELQLTLGDLAAAVSSAAQSVAYADKSEDWAERMTNRITHADALHQAGQAALARELFQAAEALQQEWQPDYPRLYSLRGFQYCDLLLAQGGDGDSQSAAVLERAGEWLHDWETRYTVKGLLDFALIQLTLGRAHLQQLLLPSTSGRGVGGEGLIPRSLSVAEGWLEQAVAALRAAGDQSYLPRGLLARAALFRHTHDFARARQDLQEVFDIAEPSGMRLHLTDYHLEMARLLVAAPGFDFAQPSNFTSHDDSGTTRCLSEAEGNTQQALCHVKAAAKLITETGYHRRDQELLDLQQALAKESCP
ncbi:SEFIR domain-containing protein [Thiothrix sp.]|jgi:tetratricopeptide (TPR) repeat protein|uniref:SEFIR domain-containing protein n=1 Tax=Thiothrix sp. TaxID=1032 RepID=UPI0025806EC4|nr:SEFIR domain-containing protein [Thiothrix sp.]